LTLLNRLSYQKYAGIPAENFDDQLYLAKFGLKFWSVSRILVSHTRSYMHFESFWPWRRSFTALFSCRVEAPPVLYSEPATSFVC
jgi:hypothetical protein